MTATIVESIVRKVQNHPDKTAIYFDGASLSYAELFNRADALARSLRQRFEQPNPVITLWSFNCLEWVVSYYGILLGGATVNPVLAAEGDRPQPVQGGCHKGQIQEWHGAPDRHLNHLQNACW